MNILSTSTAYLSYLQTTGKPRMALMAACLLSIWVVSPLILQTMTMNPLLNDSAGLSWLAIQSLTAVGCLGFVLSVPFSSKP